MQTTTNVIRVIIADDHEVYRDGFKLLIKKHARDQIKVVAEARNGIELLDKVEAHHPDIVITDVKMPVMDGIQASRLIKKNYSSTGIIALSSFDEDALIYEMFEAGVNGYLLKNADKHEMIEALQVVGLGETYYSSTTSRALFKKLAPSVYNRSRVKDIHFSAKEISIIRLICHQLTTKEISNRLNICSRTVEDYSRNIKEKINAKNLVGIALYAVKNGIVLMNEI